MDGPAEELATELYGWYTRTFLMPDGHYASCVDMNNTVTDTSFDLYNQSFSSLASPSWQRIFPPVKPAQANTPTSCWTI